MLSLLILPILICGIVWIRNSPNVSLKISLYQGWLVYLYAVTLGSVALFASWLFLEFLVPFLIDKYSHLLLKITDILRLPFAIKPNYLDLLTTLIIERFDVIIPDDRFYSVYFTVRLSVISSMSVLLTKIYFFSYTWIKSFIRKKSFEQKVLDLYENNSPSDYHLALISARLMDRKQQEKLLESFNESTIEANKTTKSMFRYLSRGYCVFFNVDTQTIATNTNYMISYYKDLLEKQKAKRNRLKQTLQAPALLAQITLDSRKVYIGMPKRIGRPDEKSIGNEEIVLLPWYSGYRSDDNQEISITNTYEEFQGLESIELSNIVIHKEKIVSVGSFSIEYYEKVKKRKNHRQMLNQISMLTR